MTRYETLTVVAPWKKHIDANNKISYHGQSAASDTKQCEQDLSSWRIHLSFLEVGISKRQSFHCKLIFKSPKHKLNV